MRSVQRSTNVAVVLRICGLLRVGNGCEVPRRYTCKASPSPSHRCNRAPPSPSPAATDLHAALALARCNRPA
ncbi:hypothetical protein B0H14DRAFT_2671213, partial [Mycena olivaceomarginata]